MRITRIAILTGVVLTVLGAAAAPTFASGTLSSYFNGFETNTTGWNETVERVTSGSTGYAYANGIPAAQGSWYARPCSGCAPFTDWGTGFNATAFPAGGFTTSLDIYLDTSYAVAHTDLRYDWDTALLGSAGEFLQDYVFNVGTSPSGWPEGTGFVVNASTNAGRENSYPENPCPSPADAAHGGYAPNVCRTPVTITTSGWYRFVHRFFNDNGYVGVEMSIVNEATHTVVPGADWTIVGSGPQSEYKGPEPISDAGGPDYGFFANEELPGLPIDDATLIVPLVTATEVLDSDMKVAQGSTLSAGYDFKMPGTHHPPATVSFSGAQATFSAACASGTPGSRTIVVSIADQSYGVAGKHRAWVPGPSRNDPSTYQGSITVPSFCDPGALVSLQQGGTFSSSVTSTDTTDVVNVRWHYKDGDGGNWSKIYSLIPG